MSDRKRIHVGVYGLVENEVIGDMFTLTETKCHGTYISELNEEHLNDFDGLLLAHPILADGLPEKIIDQIKNGMTIMLMLTSGNRITENLSSLLKYLNIDASRKVGSKCLKIKCTEHYPVSSDVNATKYVRSAALHNYLFFEQKSRNEEISIKPLITHSRLFQKLNYIVEIGLGKGGAIVTNSMMRRENQADMLDHLARKTVKKNNDNTEVELAMFKALAPNIITENFEVYDEISFENIVHKSGVDNAILQHPKFLPTIEEIIKSNSIPARIKLHHLSKSSF